MNVLACGGVAGQWRKGVGGAREPKRVNELHWITIAIERRRSKQAYEIKECLLTQLTAIAAFS